MTNGERNEELITQLFGHRWSGGNALFNLQYQHFDALSAADRDFSEETLAPTDLLPRSRQYAAMLSGRQSLGSSLEVYGNATFVDKETSRNYTDIRETRHSTSATRQYGLDVGGSIGLMRDWRMSVDGLYSKEKTDFDKVTFPAVPSCVNGTTCSKQNYEVKAVELKMDGSLLSLPAGDVKAALGASYRDEDYLAFFPADDLRQRFLSKVKAGFAEVAVPILNGDSGVSLAQALTLSAAVRHDDYNEFGSTTNPRYGISWVPMTGLNVRAAYSTSFRAPSPIERVATTFAPILASLQFSSPEGGTTPALVVIYNGAPLKPETAHNTTVGFDFTPSSVADLQVSLDYFRIDFRNRISTPPFDTGALLRPEVFGPLIQPLADDAAVQSFVAAFVADGGQFLDFSGGIVGARNVVNFQQQNAARVQQHGFDFNLSKGFEVGSGRIVAHLAATYIDEILTSFTAQSVATDIVNTYANPLKLRARADLSWSQGPWQLFGAVNYADKHTDTSAIPYGSIDAWTTVDLNATYEPRFARGLSVSLMAENVLDEPPPFAVGMGLDGIHYDVGNASPLGRFLGIELRKTW